MRKSGFIWLQWLQNRVSNAFVTVLIYSFTILNINLVLPGGTKSFNILINWFFKFAMQIRVGKGLKALVIIILLLILGRLVTVPPLSGLLALLATAPNKNKKNLIKKRHLAIPQPLIPILFLFQIIKLPLYFYFNRLHFNQPGPALYRSRLTFLQPELRLHLANQLITITIYKNKHIILKYKKKQKKSIFPFYNNK
ncbi:hypothetical protein GGTG_05273 [Gaeumannomyces tritici R3-111a-1]|uniref:Uncharacterized protein n=1 Tax=Gaeumannomyces tritici (strain R3-111a-1) TaxID=644352 RepID=J3NVF8_GAET3|nr:hypothetical protein GGTG_05273 [Gaeumannomyces tritici R3-111a-1]EJT75336.1 hypothetical protein GGTG_05273 [Gaeumannomyces tritici R3-111a-1]